MSKNPIDIDILLSAARADQQPDRAFEDKLLAISTHPQQPQPQNLSLGQRGWAWLFATGAIIRPAGAVATLLAVGIAFGVLTAPIEQENYDLSAVMVTDDSTWLLEESET